VVKYLKKKNQIIKIKEPKLRPERIINPVISVHKAHLRDDHELSEKQRLLFVARNLEVFREFLSFGFLKKIENLDQKEVDNIKLPFLLQDQPTCINKNSALMRDYQLDGVNFMLKMYQSGMSCVLADEMGLGKTIQTIAFLGSLKHDLGKKGPHLVVVPMSVLSNWMSEFKRFCPSLVIVRFHSTNKEEKDRLKKIILTGIPLGEIDVIVTTYDMLVSEGKQGIGNIRYRCLILDEAHKIKNDETIVSGACRRITRESCVFLTGTPVQNNLKECWSLLNCLQPDIITKSNLFNDAFDANDMSLINLGLVDSVWKLLKILVLRRRKVDVNLKLPPKRELRLMCPLSSQQIFWYKRILLSSAISQVTGVNDGNAEFETKGDKTKIKIKETQPEKVPLKLNNLMMQLRKICNHPFLFPHVGKDPEFCSPEDYIESSGKLAMLNRLLLTLKKENHRCVIFSQFTKMLDIIEDFITLQGYTFVRLDGQTNRIQRMINIGRYNAPNSSIFIFLLSTRAGGLGVNLQTADTCILFDSDWNPQSDIQAMGRVHRIGQVKPVTIYRMVSSDTVEERIVARATRKLLLDEMVSYGTESIINDSGCINNSYESKDLYEEEENENKGASTSDMMKALKFTMKRMFKNSGGSTIKLNLDNSIGNNMSNKNLDLSIANSRNEGIVAVDSSNSLTTVESQDNDDNDVDNDNCFALSAKNSDTKVFQGENFALTSLYKGKSLKDIKNEWEDSQNATLGKREQVSRFVAVNGVVGAGGSINVLKQNFYNLKDGEPSVYGKSGELGQKNVQSLPVPKRKQVKAGVDYMNIEFCHACGQGGKLICCDGCPMAYHPECLGFKNEKEFNKSLATKGGLPTKKYYCPHHQCTNCSKTTSQAGNLLLRCMSCPTTYCEDCADFEGNMTIIPEQPPVLLQDLGFHQCNQAVYILCTQQCSKVFGETNEYFFGKTRINNKKKKRK
jgi:SWI/SNF-related matrix-associated actin-dependent regulator of chromatin subfamily A member 5